MTLLKLKDGEQAKVNSVDPNLKSYERLLELGFITGEFVKLVRRAPLGGPLQVTIRNTSYAISREDAQHILVQ